MRTNHKKGPLSGRSQTGFTLVELLIVGALISLFAGLAIFGVQQQFKSNVRKATIGETRQIATALDFANLDTSVFPKLCFLSEGSQGMDLYSAQLQGGASVLAFAYLDINARTADPAGASALRSQWDGPYFANSQTRAGIAQGRGGFVYMQFPDMPINGPNNPTNTQGFRWPSDPYNNPYVVYMLDLDLSTPTAPVLRFVNERAPNDNTAKGNFVNAVVSYGPNNYPGGREEERIAFPGNGDAAVGTGSPFALRLYKGRPGFVSAKGRITHTYLTASEFLGTEGENRANVWRDDFLGNVGATLPSVGITDPGSDDVIFEF